MPLCLSWKLANYWALELHVTTTSHMFLPSHISNHNQFIPAEYLESQQYLERISQWTDDNQMELNTKSSTNIFIIKYSKTLCLFNPLSCSNNICETQNIVKICLLFQVWLSTLLPVNWDHSGCELWENAANMGTIEIGGVCFKLLVLRNTKTNPFQLLVL